MLRKKKIYIQCTFFLLRNVHSQIVKRICDPKSNAEIVLKLIILEGFELLWQEGVPFPPPHSPPNHSSFQGAKR